MYFILIMAIASYLLYKKKLFENKKILTVLKWSVPLPLIAIQLGWIAAEVGRQPWIVYHLMKTKDAVSFTVGTGELLFSIILFALIYILLGSIFLVLLFKKIKHGPEPIAKEALQ